MANDNKKGGIVPAGNKGLVPIGKQPGKGLAALAGGKASFKAAIAKPAATPPARRAELLATALAATSAPKGKLVFGFDATASRSPAWDRARQVTDALFEAIPGRLSVALAVHGGSVLHTFTEFSSDPFTLRDQAASIHCQAGATRMVPILEMSAEKDARVVIYIGDVFEESSDDAIKAANALKAKGCRVIILQDGDEPGSAAIFRDIASRTGGAALPFGSGSVERLRELLEAVGVLAVGGVKLLQERRKSLPGATLLLAHIKE
jgi:hypothetical protein